MLSPEELAAWYEQVKVSQQGRSVIDQVRSSDPGPAGRWRPQEHEWPLSEPENGHDNPI
jgi:hypothetical protein